MMVSTVHGALGVVSGKVELDEKDITKSTVEVSIDAAGINTADAKRDGHLKSPDFFDVAKFPAITFKSTSIAKGKAPNTFSLSGNLTMHGVTKPVTLEVEGGNEEVKDPYGNLRRGFSTTTTLNRKDYGLNWNAALDKGGVAVSEAVKVTIELEVMRPSAPAAAPAKK
jgi:polyisoprenoid-binding protein YceI